MYILDHDNGGIDHGTYRDRNTTQGHDIGVDTLHFHDNECCQDPNRQTQNNDRGRTYME